MLGKLEEVVVLTLKSFEGHARVSEVRSAIERRVGEKTSMGKVYSTITRLIEKGLVEKKISAELRDKKSQHEKVYGLTGRGQEQVKRIMGVTAKLMLAAQMPGLF